MARLRKLKLAIGILLVGGLAGGLFYFRQPSDPSMPNDPWNKGITLRSWTVESQSGRIGLGHAYGGGTKYGWSYMLYLGPFGTCVLEGPTLRFARGPYTRRALIVTGVIAMASCGLALAWRFEMTRRRKSTAKPSSSLLQ